MKVDLQSLNAKPVGRVDVKHVDATTEPDIADHQAEDGSGHLPGGVEPFLRRYGDIAAALPGGFVGARSSKRKISSSGTSRDRGALPADAGVHLACSYSKVIPFNTLVR
ncbi:MAG: hypothetical protein EB072_20370 [Betaproteobacteria bacterium]|nr:hypothetical protein [Betaproteobacteria bacterium]